MISKQALRERYTQKRAELTEADIDAWSLDIANLSLTLPIWEQTYYHLFLTITQKRELNTEYLLHILQGKDKSVVVSKSDFKTKQLTHYLLQENTRLVVSKYGIPEPENGLEIQPKQLDVVFVPLLTFDLKGNRVGYGGGFYDRFLAKCRPDCLKIGLSFFDPVPEILHENIDFPLNLCITPKKIYRF